jgi:hypothetical protein
MGRQEPTVLTEHGTSGTNGTSGSSGTEWNIRYKLVLLEPTVQMVLVERMERIGN